MRILYITQWFDPEPAFKGFGFTKRLSQKGCDVRVATGFPNYPGGKLYQGYRLRPFRRERMGGIIVDRLFLYPSHSRSNLGRALNYVSFGLSLGLYGLFALGRRDAIYVYHPPITAALAAVLVGLLRRRPVVVDIQDLWPDTLTATGMAPGATGLKLVERVCRFVYARATRLIVQSPGFKRRLVERGVPEAKIETVLNWAQEDEAIPRGVQDLTSLGLADRFNILFAGTLGLAQGLDVVLNAAKLVATAEPRVQFLLMGDGVEAARLADRIASEALRNVRMVPRVAKAEVADILAAADVLLVTLTDNPLFAITIPSKTQFYLCMGKPVLMSARGDAATLVQKAGAGICVPPGNAAALAEAAIRLARCAPPELDAMGARGKAYYFEQLSLDAGIARTLAVLRDMSKRP